MNGIRALLILAFVGISYVPAHAAEEHVWLRVDGKYIKTSPYSKTPNQIWMGAGDTIAYYYMLWGAVKTDKTPGFDVEERAEMARRHGVNFVRLAVNTLPYPQTWFPGLGGQGLTITESIANFIAPTVEAIKARGMYTIIDEHCHMPGIFLSTSTGDSPTAMPWSDEQFQNWYDQWTAMATYFKDEPWVMGYELMNEPLGPQSTWWTTAVLREKTKMCVQAVRQVDQKHILFISSIFYTHLFSLVETWGPDFNPDPNYRNVSFTFHDYPSAWDYSYLPNGISALMDQIQNTYNISLIHTEWNVTAAGLLPPSLQGATPDKIQLRKDKQAEVINTCFRHRAPWCQWYDVQNSTSIDYMEVWLPLAAEQATPAQQASTGPAVIENPPVPVPPAVGAKVGPNPLLLRGAASAVVFSSLEPRTTLKIFTLSGKLVAAMQDPDMDNSITWDCRNTGGMRISPGLYIYVLTDDSGNKKPGKLLIR